MIKFITVRIDEKQKKIAKRKRLAISAPRDRLGADGVARRSGSSGSAMPALPVRPPGHRGPPAAAVRSTEGKE